MQILNMLNESFDKLVLYTFSPDNNPTLEYRAVFDIDSKKYAVILSKTNMYGMWVLTFGHVPNSSLKLFKLFPKHTRKVLTTIFHIISEILSPEGQFKSFNQDIKGIAIKVPEEVKDIHIKLLDLILQKPPYSQLVKRVIVSNNNPDDEGFRYLFVVRKNVSDVTKLFKNKEFKKYEIASDQLKNELDNLKLKKKINLVVKSDDSEIQVQMIN